MTEQQFESFVPYEGCEIYTYYLPTGRVVRGTLASSVPVSEKDGKPLYSLKVNKKERLAKGLPAEDVRFFLVGLDEMFIHKEDAKDALQEALTQAFEEKINAYAKDFRQYMHALRASRAREETEEKEE